MFVLSKCERGERGFRKDWISVQSIVVRFVIVTVTVNLYSASRGEVLRAAVVIVVFIVVIIDVIVDVFWQG